MNCRPSPVRTVPPTRSRGVLAIAAATAAGHRAAASAALSEALGWCSRERFDPFSLVFLSMERSWMLSWNGPDGGASEPRVTDLSPGWHVVTHRDLDDRSEPRTARLLRELAGFSPASEAAARARLRELLSLHAGAGSNPGDDAAVCLHDGPMPTVSYALGSVTPRGISYRHGEGRPCEVDAGDFSSLLVARGKPP